MNMKQWIASLPGSPLPTQAAEKAKIDRGTISRQIDRGSISAANVIKIARAYGASPVDALVNTGHLQAAEIKVAGIADALKAATNRELLAEVVRRSDPNAKLLLRGGNGAITPKGKRVVPDKPEPRLREHGGRLKRNVDDADDSAGQ